MPVMCLQDAQNKAAHPKLTLIRPIAINYHVTLLSYYFANHLKSNISSAQYPNQPGIEIVQKANNNTKSNTQRRND